MKRLLTGLFLIASTAAMAAPADFSGRWDVAVREFGQKNFYLPMQDGRLVVTVEGDHAMASFNRLMFHGTAGRDSISLDCMDGASPCGTLTLKLNRAGLLGEGQLLGIPVTLTGKRPLAKPASATAHDYDPKEFRSFFSPALPPVLRLFPGDSVKTRTADSRGQDRDGLPKAPRGNPQTGPFYVEGAMPGDTLVVRLDRVRTNRATAYQSNTISTNALLPSYLLGEPQRDPQGSAVWNIDTGAGVATLAQPGDKLAGYKVRLQPMLGCIGVAPPRDETFGSGRLGPYGGNLDYREMREGVTVYLPVFQPGALLYIGDGHAVQGDGELPGQGLETSLDVTFTVNVIEGRSLGQTWVEDADYVMVMGAGSSMDDSLKQATTGMARWLADNHGLNQAEIAAVLGTAMQYQIAEVVDSEYNIVAKIRKDALAQIRR
jgi:acetamidase/formamidase